MTPRAPALPASSTRPALLGGSVSAALAMTLVGSSVSVLGLLRGFPVYAGQALRFAVAAGLLLLVIWARERRGRGVARPATGRDWVRIVLLSATGMVGFNVAVVAAERHTDPALVGVIVGCAPLVIALVHPLAAGKAPNRRLLVAGLVVTAGAATAQGVGSGGSTVGVLLAVCALAGEVAFALVAAPVVDRLGALRVSTYACAAAVPICLLGVVVTGQAMLPTGTEALALLWLGIAVTAGAYLCWFGAVGRIGPERAGLFIGLVPISAVAVTALLGTGQPTGGHLAGAILVVVGLLIGARPTTTTTTE